MNKAPFALPVYVSAFSVSIIDAAVASSLPALPQFARSYAVARGLGFRDGASLQSAIAGRTAGPVDADGQSFATHLVRMDHQATASMFYNAAALSALHLVARFRPLLGRSGYGPIIDQPSDLKDDVDRLALASPVSVSGFLQATAFLQTVRGCLDDAPTANSYALKHIAERRRCSYPDGSRVGTGYVTNGEMIAAGIYVGLNWAPDEARGSRNILFGLNMRRIERMELRGARDSAPRSRAV